MTIQGMSRYPSCALRFAESWFKPLAPDASRLTGLIALRYASSWFKSLTPNEFLFCSALCALRSALCEFLEVAMLLKSCLSCKYHEITNACEEQTSRCLRENCYARYSKCVVQKALEQFLCEDSSKQHKPFSALTHLYSGEWLDLVKFARGFEDPCVELQGL